MKARPRRVTLPAAPAPSSRILEAAYYPTVDTVVATALETVGRFQP
jgi:acetoin:2,6-dichlorophenolindophenol oxidoreductase subunit beta